MLVNGNKTQIIVWVIGIIFFAGSLVATFRLTADDVCRVKMVVADHETRMVRLEEKMIAMRATQDEMRADIKELLALMRSRR